MKRIGSALTVAIAAAVVAYPLAAEACFSPVPKPPSAIFAVSHGDTDGDGKPEFSVGIQVSLFAPPSTTTCLCGISPGSQSGPPLPSSLMVTGVSIDVTNLSTLARTPIPAFGGFMPNAIEAAHIAGGIYGVPPAAIWSAFTGAVDPFMIPTLGAGEGYVSWFDMEVDPADIRALFAQPFHFISGALLAPGVPLPGHEPGFGGPFVVPEPASLGLIGLGLVLLLSGRPYRRRNRPVRPS